MTSVININLHVEEKGLRAALSGCRSRMKSLCLHQYPVLLHLDVFSGNEMTRRN